MWVSFARPLLCLHPAHNQTISHQTVCSSPQPFPPYSRHQGGSTRAACGIWHRPSSSRAGHSQARAGDHRPYLNPLIQHADHHLCLALHLIARWGEEEGGKERHSLLPPAPTKQKPNDKSVRSLPGFKKYRLKASFNTKDL